MATTNDRDRGWVAELLDDAAADAGDLAEMLAAAHAGLGADDPHGEIGHALATAVAHLTNARSWLASGATAAIR